MPSHPHSTELIACCSRCGRGRDVEDEPGACECGCVKVTVHGGIVSWWMFRILNKVAAQERWFLKMKSPAVEENDE